MADICMKFHYLPRSRRVFEKCTNLTFLKPMLTITMPVPPMLRETFILIPMSILLAQAVVTKLTSPKHVRESYFTKTCQPELLQM